MKFDNLIVGLFLGLGGIIALTAMDAVVKSLGASLPTLEIVFVRYAGAAVWLALYIIFTRRAWPKQKNMRRHAIRGVLMALTAFLFFFAVSRLPLAVVTALAMTAPIYVSFMGIVFLKEQPHRSLYFAIGLAVLGSLVVVFGNSSETVDAGFDVLAWGAAALAPLSYASALVLLKHHSADDGAAAMTFAQSAVGALVVFPLAVPEMVLPPAQTWFGIILVGIFGTIGFLFLLAGLRRLPASVFALVDYTALLWAAFFGFVFFQESVQPSLWLGGAMIIAACGIGVGFAKKSTPEGVH